VNDDAAHTLLGLLSLNAHGLELALMCIKTQS